MERIFHYSLAVRVVFQKSHFFLSALFKTLDKMYFAQRIVVEQFICISWNESLFWLGQLQFVYVDESKGQCLGLLNFFCLVSDVYVR